MMIDSHAHLYAEDFRSDFDDVVGRARDAGVACMICPGTNVATSTASADLADSYESIYAAAGVHPHDAGKVSGGWLDAIGALAERERVVAIGEIGLDYHYDFAPRDVQQDVFSRQVELAAALDMPVIIHSRESEPDVERIVADRVARSPEWGKRPDGIHRGVFHCFPGDGAMAARVIALGFHVSFPGLVTFPPRPSKPNGMSDVAAAVPSNRFLIETDSPYLAPQGFRGKRNEPSRLPVIAEAVARLRGADVGEVASATTANCRALFGLGETASGSGRG
jgi:TatD DNase family protein